MAIWWLPDLWVQSTKWESTGRLRGIMANLVGAAGIRLRFAEIDHHLIPGPKLLEPKRPDFVI